MRESKELTVRNEQDSFFNLINSKSLIVTTL